MYGTVGEKTYVVLRDAILTGALANGLVLRQESLAAELGISRVPVRDALRQLEADGLVVAAPRRGARVRSLSPELVEQTFELRLLLETHALRRSIETMTPDRAGRLTELAMRLDTPDPEDNFRELLLQFYHVMYDAEGNAVLTGLIDRLRDSVGRQYVARPIHAHDHSHHRELVFPIISGRTEEAVKNLTEHLDTVKAAILANSAPPAPDAE
ncbi:MAG: GntR family transcriptional regulator [Microbacterium sp.]